MRCQNCGHRNIRQATMCSNCQSPLKVSPNNTLNRRVDTLTLDRDTSSLNSNVAFEPLNRVLELRPPEPEKRRRPRRPKSITGEIIAQETTHPEPPGFNIFYVITRLCWGILFIGIPFLIFRSFWAALGPFSLILSIVILYYTLRNLNPLNILALVHLLGFFNPFHRREEQLPVRYFRLRTEEGDETVVRIKGHYKSGNCAVGDLVTFCGRWRHGTFFARKGFNQRTGSKILLRRDYSILAFSLTLFFTIWTVILCISFYMPYQNAVKDKLSGLENVEKPHHAK